jgi:hypothetical protein
MDQWLQAIREQLSDHGIKYLTAAGFTLAGWLAARWKAARDWRKREFFNRLNVSLNALHDGQLLIRTVLEKSCAEIFLNSLAAQRLIQAAQKTTPDNPFIPIRNEDRWFYLNAVLNELSERFANGLFRREAGLTVNAQRFLICLTNEADGDVRTRKIRAMVIRKDLLENLPQTPLKLEKPGHKVRWKTLQLMQQKWKSDPTLFIEVEVVV